MSSQGIMSSKKGNHDPGLCPIEGQMSGLALKLGPKINSWSCLLVLPRPTYPSKSLVKQLPSIFPNRIPMERDTSSSELMVCSFVYVC